MRDTAAIIVAGGKGLRFGGSVRKQYLTLQGKPILWWSLRAFQKSPSIAQIIMVLPADDAALWSSSPAATGRGSIHRWIPRQGLRGMTPPIVVAGGAARSDSVRHGLAAVLEECRYVAVHDAVRPLVSPALIEKVLRQARIHKAAIAAIPSKDTVKLANGDGCIHETPPREKVWLAQTPQIFEKKLLVRAHARGRHVNATDDAQLVERLGVRVRLVEASSENLKITKPIDLFLAQSLLKGR